jgi:hypothetical protein
MVRRASKKKKLLVFGFLRLSSFGLRTTLLICSFSLSPSGGVFFFYFCIAKLELGYCCYFF